MSGAGKGDKRRPGAIPDGNWERAFGKRPQHPAGAADAFGPTKDGCCGVTVTKRCDGCPHVRGKLKDEGGNDDSGN